jgi:transcriptional regulator with XRE-family HTH domain
MQGKIESGNDIASLRRFVGLSQTEFAKALGISVHTLRNWEQGRRKPDGPALALLKIAARHPKLIAENLATAGVRVATFVDAAAVDRAGRHVQATPFDFSKRRSKGAR